MILSDSLNSYASIPGEIPNLNKKSCLNCMFANARSLMSNLKLEELQAYAKEKDLDLIGIAETWLSDKILNSEIKLEGYTLHRKDRSTVKEGKGGGVILYVRDTLVSLECTELNKLQNESVWCDIMTGKGISVLVGVVYKSPSAGHEEVKEILTMLSSLSGKHVIIMGDFNYPKINWNTFESDSAGGLFLEVILDNFWSQHVFSPTREDNVLDLVISSEESMVENISVDEHLGNSDHNIVNFNLVIVTEKKLVSKLDMIIIEQTMASYWNL